MPQTVKRDLRHVQARDGALEVLPGCDRVDRLPVRLTEDEIAEGPEAKVTAGNETTANRDNLVGRLQRVKRKSTKV